MYTSFRLGAAAISTEHLELSQRESLRNALSLSFLHFTVVLVEIQVQLYVRVVSIMHEVDIELHSTAFALTTLRNMRNSKWT